VNLTTKDFSFALPEELIAQSPILNRDTSRMMVMDRKSGELTHRHFFDLLQVVRPGDCLVLNNSRVLPARLLGTDSKGYPVEVLLLKDRGEGAWECIVYPGKKCREGAMLSFGEGLLRGQVLQVKEDGNRLISFACEGLFLECLERLGAMPLPPYIKEKLSCKERYQTVYAKVPGSAAAPTAGLHFTDELLSKLADMGVTIAYLTLHVGLGTFRPVKVSNVTEHVMHSEEFSLPEEAAAKILAAKAAGGRIIAVGTTAVRTLETVAARYGTICAAHGETAIFIYPGHAFLAVDGIITNFHLPESTLIMLVSAFSSREHVLRAYEAAIAEKYRFYSFGDCMLLL